MIAGDHNLARLSEQSLARLGDRAALFFEGAWFRSGEMHARASRLGGGIVARGIRPGDRAVVMMSNSPDVGAIYNALWRAGAVVTPAIFLLSEADLVHILVDSAAVAVFTSPEFLPKVLGAVAAAPSVRHIFCIGDPDGAISLEELAAADPLDVVGRGDGDLAALMYTGGTTGRAKGVMLTHENLWHAGWASHEAGTVPGVNRSLVSLPLSHAFGLLVTVVGMHATEPGSSVLMRWFEPAACVALAATHGVQIIPAVPSMLQLLLAQPLEDFDLSALRYIASGAAPLPAEAIRRLEERLPGVEVREGYGLTETAGIISSTRPGGRRDGSVGQPVPGCEVRIVDDAGRDVATGDPGEICARSPMVMAGYWAAPDLTAETVVDGWLHTGDIGRLDSDGYLYILDRKKDLIIRGGFNVFPRDVEDALAEHPAVQSAAVVGRPDAERGEEVVAFVALTAGASATEVEILEFGRTRLGGYKYPREVHIIEHIPLTPVGKIDRKVLRARLAGIRRA